jgi:hypothetical protein
MLESPERLEDTVSQQIDDDDDDFALERNIARDVEEAFAHVPYPGDDKLLRYPGYYENDDVLATFRGKHWKDITPQMLVVHQHSLSLFSPEAFRFFLPCLLISAMLHSDVTDLLWGTLFYNLAPGHSDMDFLNERTNLLDARQKSVVRRYVELYVQTETSLPDPRKEQALAFWRRITEPANAT